MRILMISLPEKNRFVPYSLEILPHEKELEIQELGVTLFAISVARVSVIKP